MKTPEQCGSLDDVRLGIDSLDREIIAALGRRLAYAKAADRFKPDEASIAAPQRVAAMLPERRACASQGARVLVVDDEPHVRAVIVEVVRELGCEVLEAGDGAAALAILQSPSQLDLLITDVGLPGGINGHQVADAARSLRAGLKVLLVSGYAENAAISRGGGLAAGMQVLSKPFSIDTLARRIVDLMDNEPP